MKSFLLFLTAFFTSNFKERRDLALPEPCIEATVGPSQARAEASDYQEQRSSLLGLVVSHLESLVASGCPSESIEFPLPRLLLSDQRRSEWSEISRLEA